MGGSPGANLNNINGRRISAAGEHLCKHRRVLYAAAPLETGEVRSERAWAIAPSGFPSQPSTRRVSSMKKVGYRRMRWRRIFQKPPKDWGSTMRMSTRSPWAFRIAWTQAERRRYSAFTSSGYSLIS